MLSTGAKVGILVAIFVVLAGTGVGLYFLLRNKTTKKKTTKGGGSSTDNKSKSGGSSTDNKSKSGGSSTDNKSKGGGSSTDNKPDVKTIQIQCSSDENVTKSDCTALSLGVKSIKLPMVLKFGFHAPFSSDSTPAFWWMTGLGPVCNMLNKYPATDLPNYNSIGTGGDKKPTMGQGIKYEVNVSGDGIGASSFGTAEGYKFTKYIGAQDDGYAFTVDKKTADNLLPDSAPTYNSTTDKLVILVPRCEKVSNGSGSSKTVLGFTLQYKDENEQLWSLTDGFSGYSQSGEAAYGNYYHGLMLWKKSTSTCQNKCIIQAFTIHSGDSTASDVTARLFNNALL